MFSDIAKIYVKAGDGGNGCLGFLHEKYREFGGPDGGDGGNGGNVILTVDSSWNTLYFYKTHRQILARNGEHGKGRNKHGHNGEDLMVHVPVGTMVYNDDSGNLICDLDNEGKEYVVAKGGEGGFGNAHFISSTRQKPQFAELGTKGEELNLRLELKLIADVGLVGLPNIGKSTFLSVVTSAKPKVADYPFTTITPNLGVVENFGPKGFIIADIPGLIAGASKGKGLGDDFLRHIERTNVIIHFLDAKSQDIQADFDLINNELKSYNASILKKPQILVISRSDLLNQEEKDAIKVEAQKIIKKHKTIFKFDKIPFLLSSVTHDGLKELIYEVEKELEKKPNIKVAEPERVFTINDVKDNLFNVEKKGKFYIITGLKIEKFAQKTDFNNIHAVLRLYDIMNKMGIIKQISAKGAQIGDKIKIIDKEIEYQG
jgi:GTP-binding protein